jgi:protein involved in polysaccharide export with SLBB domain
MRSSPWSSSVLLAAFVAATTLCGLASGQDNPAEPPKAEPPKAEPAKPEPSKVEAPKVETARPAPADPTHRDLDSYRLRVGDRVTITVYNGNKLTPELTQSLSVPGNGEASFPPIGKVHLLDRTVVEIQDTVAQRFKDESYLANPNVGCVVTEYEPRVVYLIGAAHGTITLPVFRNMRILEVLAKAGGLGSAFQPNGPPAGGALASASYGSADFSNVRVRRVGADGMPFTFKVNVDDILERDQEQQNIVIFENDIVIVPKLEGANPQSADWVYVLGKVHQPGRQPIIKGRTPFSLTKLIALCGDFQEFADRTKVRIIRTTPTGRESIPIDFDDIIENKRPDFELKPDDLVYVPENWI